MTRLRSEAGQTTVELALMAGAIIALVPLLLAAISLWAGTLQSDAQASVSPDTGYVYPSGTYEPTAPVSGYVDPGDGIHPAAWWCVDIAGNWVADVDGPDSPCPVV